VQRIQYWIRNSTIAAEQRGVAEGSDYLLRLLRDAAFQRAERMPTDGVPGVFATLDAGANRTIGLDLDFMYDVKQANSAEWSSPPWEAAFLAALHAIRAAGRRLPVNLVPVVEG